jgi:hypothetical protein
VLRNCLRVIRPGGAIFVGDVRNFCLLDKYHASIRRFHAAPELPLVDLASSIRSKLGRERDLFVDPAFFPAMGQELDRFGHVQIHLGRGRGDDQWMKYHYNVMIHLDRVSDDAPGETHDASAGDWPLSRVRELLAGAPRRVELQRVPNARLDEDLAILDILEEPRGATTAGELAAQLAGRKRVGGVDPEDVLALAGPAWSIWTSWSVNDREGRFDVVMAPRESAPIPGPTFAITRELPPAGRSWESYTSASLRARAEGSLEERLRRHLARVIPELPAGGLEIVEENPEEGEGA